MATYAIGDVQGCFVTLQRLLEKIAFDPTHDTLWFAGDLVNRGPGSLEVLRFAYANRKVVKMVLGNHDLHFLGRVVSVRRAGRRDTLDALLAAKDRDQLVEWLRRQPLLLRRGDLLMVHAGLLPAWTADEAEERSNAVQRVLGSDDWSSLLAAMWSKSKRPKKYVEEQRTIAVMTLLRILDPDLEPAYEFKRGPDDVPPGYVPWFEAPGRKTSKEVVLFGHWAALGHHLRQRIIALDSGCVWGHELTAVRLEDRAVFQVPNAETTR